MGYNNRFKLTILESANTDVLICPKCQKGTSGKFCADCGTPLSTVSLEMEPKTLIGKFREYSEDASYLLSADGSTYEEGSGYSINEDLEIFSRQYPEAVFQLDVKPDPGFESPDERHYIKNGKSVQAEVKTIYEEFNPEKFK